MSRRQGDFDPLGLLTALERHRVNYVIVGGFAALVHGSGLATCGIDIVPSLREENLARLAEALDELGASQDGAKPLLDAEALAGGPVALETDGGEMKIVATPAGTRGYDDLRRAAAREPLGSGLRPLVASLADVIRSIDALGREQDEARLPRLRRLAELERERGLEL